MFGNPFLHSSYFDSDDYYNPFYARSPLAQRQALAQQQALQQERAQRRAQRLQRSKYLPDEVDDVSDEDDWIYRDAIERRRAYERRQEEQKIINQQREKQEMLDQIAREQEDQRREALRQAHRQRQAQNRPHRPPPRSPSPSQSPYKQGAPLQDPSTSPQRSPSPTPEPEQLKHTVEEQNEAAIKIQTAFRIHKALTTLKELENQFDTLRTSFTLPPVIDFQGPRGTVSVSVPTSITEATNDINTPKLAYNQTNYALHSYTESLNRLLIKLDGVESWGDATVRKSRRRIVGRVEIEANRIEVYWKQAWASYIVDTEQ